MQISTNGLILRQKNFDENDSLLTILTEDAGVISAYAKGTRKLKSRLASSAQLLSYSHFTLFKNKERYSLDHAESIRMFFKLRQDLDKLSLASYFAELALELAPREEEAGDFLRLLLGALSFLEEEKRPAKLLKAVCELRMLSMAGYMPDLTACQKCGKFEGEMRLLLKSGELLCRECAGKEIPLFSFPLEKGVLAAMRFILYSELKNVFQFRLGEDSLSKLSQVSEQFLLIQTEKTFAALDFLKQL